MFGTQRDFDKRITEYRNGLTGIKHLHRLQMPPACPVAPATESADHNSSDKPLVVLLMIQCAVG